MSYSWQLLANDWDSLTDSEKEALFLGTEFVKPSVAELQAIGEPFKVASYNIISASLRLHVKGAPKDKLVLPKAMFGSDFEFINSITPVVVENNDGKVRFIITKDLTTYYTWNGTGFVEVSALDGATVISEGMSASTINSLGSADWLTFFTAGDEIGIGFALEKPSSTAEAKVDSLQLSVDMRGSWKKAVHGTDYDYRYSSNTLLKVEILLNGTYKINYSKGN